MLQYTLNVRSPSVNCIWAIQENKQPKPWSNISGASPQLLMTIRPFSSPWQSLLSTMPHTLPLCILCTSNFGVQPSSLCTGSTESTVPNVPNGIIFLTFILKKFQYLLSQAQTRVDRKWWGIAFPLNLEGWHGFQPPIWNDGDVYGSHDPCHFPGDTQHK